MFSTTKPKEKLEILKSLQRQGAVTAITYDGVNNAPAPNQGALAMILVDDNVCSIVLAVAFIMSMHIAEIVQIFVCIFISIPDMRTPAQILL